MTPTKLFEEARLSEAIAAQLAAVHDQPANDAERLLLCDLLAFTGARTAVRTQLDRLTSPELHDYLAEWRRLLAADERRHTGSPGFLLEPPPHVGRRLQALEQLSSRPAADVLDLIDEADEHAPWAHGHLDGRPFDGWRDADDLLGPVVEAFHGDRYVWLPVDQITKLRLEPAEGLRDRLYWPATIWLVNQTEREVFLPALYAGTAAHAEEGIRTGAGVDWLERNGLMRGAGSRVFLFGEEELALAEFRQVEVRSIYTG